MGLQFRGDVLERARIERREAEPAVAGELGREALAEPLKITSVIESPRRWRADNSPITQRTASMMLDLPQPLGPTTPVRLVANGTAVGSTKDLKPASFTLVRRIR
jgi:hypothetical protein